MPLPSTPSSPQTIKSEVDEVYRAINELSGKVDTHFSRKDQEYAKINAAFAVAARILAVRFFLFLSLIGAFVLALLANQNGSGQIPWIMLLFSVVTTGPLTMLEIYNRKG